MMTLKPRSDMGHFASTVVSFSIVFRFLAFHYDPGGRPFSLSETSSMTITSNYLFVPSGYQPHGIYRNCKGATLLPGQWVNFLSGFYIVYDYGIGAVATLDRLGRAVGSCY